MDDGSGGREEGVDEETSGVCGEEGGGGQLLECGGQRGQIAQRLLGGVFPPPQQRRHLLRRLHQLVQQWCLILGPREQQPKMISEQPHHQCLRQSKTCHDNRFFIIRIGGWVGS